MLHNVDQTNVGNYDCIARNDYGEEKKTLRLLVDDVEHVSKNHSGKKMCFHIFLIVAIIIVIIVFFLVDRMLPGKGNSRRVYVCL